VEKIHFLSVIDCHSRRANVRKLLLKLELSFVINSKLHIVLNYKNNKHNNDLFNYVGDCYWGFLNTYCKITKVMIDSLLKIAMESKTHVTIKLRNI